MTQSRRLLLRCLFEHRGHRTAEELVDEVNALDPAVHRSTIYRNLDELEQLGVVEHVHLGHGPATYHLRAERHGHLVCEHCGRSVEVPEDVFADLERVALRRYGFHLRPRHFAIQGICASCAASEAAEHSEPSAGCSKTAEDRSAEDCNAGDRSAEDRSARDRSAEG